MWFGGEGLLEVRGKRRVRQDPSSGLFCVFHWPCVAGKVGSWSQPGLFLLGKSVEKEGAKEGEGVYKEVIIVIMADC